MKTRKEVLRWLKDNGLYRKISRRLPYPIEKHMSDDIHLDEFILAAFDWKLSAEGAEYWNDINKQFTDWYNNNEDND